ncbi:MAG: lytic murein transglycosylase, partial [Pseudomonas sp.]
QLLAIHSNTLTQLEQRYGVPRQILVAVWGMESNFGSNMGDNNVIRALATLAFEGRRPQFASEQLLAALQILQQGDVTPERMLGSWAGAMGQTQFIPSTYQQHAVDFDGDGRRDIWTSSADALASTANYLKSSGWQRGQQWGIEVNLPPTFDYALADMDLRKSVAEWRALGIRPIGALYGSAADAQSASLLLPAGYRGPAFLVFDNFRSILRYNNSAAYAMGVSLLAAQFYGGGQIMARWPRDEVMLTRTERIEMQQLLLNLGLYSGEMDGIIGTNTKRAIRSSQQQLNLPADGYPTKRLLERLRTLTL